MKGYACFSTPKLKIQQGKGEQSYIITHTTEGGGKKIREGAAHRLTNQPPNSCPTCRVLDQHKLTKDQWEERIQIWHEEHGSMLK